MTNSSKLYESSVDSYPTEKIDLSEVTDAVQRTKSWLLTQQHKDGHWCAELEGDSILQSEYILLLAWLGKEQTATAKKCAAHLLKQQRSDGSWGMYPEGQLEISASVKAYFALKLTGHDPKADYMLRARNAILEAGGADTVNSFTRFYLALLGQIPYQLCPAVPPEMVLLPSWFPINIYRMSAWSRTIFVPLSIMWAHQPVRELPPELSIKELFINDPEQWRELRCPGMEKPAKWFSWDRFFRLSDKCLKKIEAWKIRPLRKRALKLAQQWMLDRFQKSDGLGAIFPPIIWSVVALKCQGYSDESEEVQDCLKQLDRLMIEESGTIRLQPCKSPVWDTTITMRAIAAAGIGADDVAGKKAMRWLLSKEVKSSGDWNQTVKSEPGGWYFEYANEFYPDLDDTAMGLMAIKDQLETAEIDLDVHAGESLTNTSVVTGLARMAPGEIADQLMLLDDISACTKRAVSWIAAMQNRDGGWGAFDKDNNAQFLCHVPFADHNAMIDPSTPDLSARVIEALGRLGIQHETTGKLGDVVKKCVQYLKETQELDGSWFGRWGVNYIYGTWQCLVGLKEVGISTDDDVMVTGAGWLLRTQQANGGWGETCNSYEDPTLQGKGETTPSQTAWALLGLMAAGHTNSEAVQRGVQYLINTQNADGTWNEIPYTGTGFPRVFYLKYHYYRIYFPLLALASWKKKQHQLSTSSTR